VISDSGRRAASGDLDLVATFRIIWRGRWMIVSITAAFIIAAVVYSFVAREWFRAEAVLIQTDSNSSVSTGQLGGLASLAGISLGREVDPIALMVLKSREFAREFIEEKGLLGVLFADQWDPVQARWIDPSSAPDIRDAVDYFDARVRGVAEDRRTGEIRLSITWTDPELAADWVNEMVRAVNSKLRDKALEEARQNIEFLRGQIREIDMPVLQQAVSKALESEMQKLMLAKKGDEYAFKVIDRAIVPKTRDSPRRTMVTLLAAAVGLLTGIAFVLVRDGVKTAPA
jgi:uncharacterized protein involved in exopolysaccharide biosynthesis